MRQHLASLLLASALGGCSLLYNPSDIPKQMDAPEIPIDAPFDGDPSMLKLTSIAPATLFEGQGSPGTQPAVLVIKGENIVKQNTTVTWTKSAAALKTPMLMIDNSQLEVSTDGTLLAVPVILPVDGTVMTGNDTSTIDITVMQDGPTGHFMQTLTAKVTVEGLDEINGNASTLTAKGLYSSVNITAGTIGPALGGAPIVIRSITSVSISGATIALNASTTMGSAGGGNGGAGGALTVTGTNPGGAGTGPAGGMPSGMAGGFTGDLQLNTFDPPERGSGGSGGAGTTLAAGTAGGGGGGSIEISAGSTLTVGAISAKGAAATAGSNVGGGGSGGVIFLHAGGNLMAGALDVSGGGSGAAGRIRVDAGGTSTVTPAPAIFHRGPMFVDMPVITTDARPTITVIGKPLAAFKYYMQNASGSQVRGPFMATVPAAGPATIVFGDTEPEALFPGLNQFCLIVGSADATSNTGNCRDIAWIGH